MDTVEGYHYATCVEDRRLEYVVGCGIPILFPVPVYTDFKDTSDVVCIFMIYDLNIYDRSLA